MADSLPRTWLQSDRVLARRLGRPISAFLHVEASGGILLVCAAIAALVWANSGWSDSYERFFHTSLTISIGSFTVKDSLAHAINDGLMAVFFFVVGLEIKREWWLVSFGTGVLLLCRRLRLWGEWLFRR
ncbi:MAG: Na+/H+ antiporter NhaA [Acidimicrobiales bacterium]|nr:Na+/H+ antiporter NhaA [Acidimicrobiales bacterium]